MNVKIEFYINFFLIRVLYATLVEGLEYLQGSFQVYPAYYIFNFLLVSLQIMHVVWFIMILRVLARVLKKDKKVKDDRSDSESEENDDADEEVDETKKEK